MIRYWLGAILDAIRWRHPRCPKPDPLRTCGECGALLRWDDAENIARHEAWHHQLTAAVNHEPADYGLAPWDTPVARPRPDISTLTPGPDPYTNRTFQPPNGTNP